MVGQLLSSRDLGIVTAWGVGLEEEEERENVAAASVR